jgi:hypothetical protein
MSTTPTPAGSGASPQPPSGGGGFTNPGGYNTGGSPFPPGPGGPIAPPAGTEVPGVPAAVTVATYPNYADAQRAVDYLSDNNFPVENTAIIGTDLRLVENVTGRVTVARAALAGAASGAWFGLFFGLIIDIFTNANWWGVLIAAILIGAAWGAIFGAYAHAATRGQRDFSSRSSLQASQYAIIVAADKADEARHKLVQMNWRATNAR